MSFNKVIVIGGLPGGEVWSSGFSLTSDGGAGMQDPTDLAAWAEEIRLLINGWGATHGLRAGVSSAGTFTAVRCESRSEDESLINFGEAPWLTSFTGGGTASKPHSSAFVISLRSLTPGGRGRGRMFWPALGQTIETATLRISAANRTSILVDSRSFFNAVIAAAAPEFIMHLAVRSVTYHLSHQVTTLQVGDVLDVQRRRRDELAEVYSSIDFPGP